MKEVKETVTEPQANIAYALVVDGNRFFGYFGRRGRLQTAWSLAGAKLFLFIDSDVAERVRSAGKGHKVYWTRVVVEQ